MLIHCGISWLPIRTATSKNSRIMWPKQIKANTIIAIAVNGFIFAPYWLNFLVFGINILARKRDAVILRLHLLSDQQVVFGL